MTIEFNSSRRGTEPGSRGEMELDDGVNYLNFEILGDGTVEIEMAPVDNLFAYRQIVLTPTEFQTLRGWINDTV